MADIRVDHLTTEQFNEIHRTAWVIANLLLQAIGETVTTHDRPAFHLGHLHDNEVQIFCGPLLFERIKALNEACVEMSTKVLAAQALQKARG